MGCLGLCLAVQVRGDTWHGSCQAMYLLLPLGRKARRLFRAVWFGQGRHAIEGAKVEFSSEKNSPSHPTFESLLFFFCISSCAA